MTKELSLQTTLKNLPHKPGIYKFYAVDDTLLYIGKAKDLKKRVVSYFQEGRPRNERLTLMISQITKIDYSVVNSEKESLLLEASLIHTLQPKFNILLKDNRDYIYIRITNDEIPGIFLTRKKFDPESIYFGPYTSQRNTTEILRVLRIILPYCQEKRIGTKPCNYVGIKQCDGICAGQEKLEDYLAKIEQIKNVLKGKTDLVDNFLKNKMQEAVNLGNFELAGLWRDRASLFNSIKEKQQIVLPTSENLDLVTLITEEQENGSTIGSIFLQNIRDGKIINVNNFLLSGNEESEDENQNQEFNFLKSFFGSYYYYQADTAPILLQTFRS